MARVMQRIEREMTAGERRAVNRGESIEITAMAARTGLPENCDDCGDWITYWLDPEGIWSECACDAGYLT